VELQKALQENSIARCPVLTAQYDGKDVRHADTCLSMSSPDLSRIALFLLVDLMDSADKA
jgi:hypothetical protein